MKAIILIIFTFMANVALAKCSNYIEGDKIEENLFNQSIFGISYTLIDEEVPNTYVVTIEVPTNIKSSCNKGIMLRKKGAGEEYDFQIGLRVNESGNEKTKYVFFASLKELENMTATASYGYNNVAWAYMVDTKLEYNQQLNQATPARDAASGAP